MAAASDSRNINGGERCLPCNTWWAVYRGWQYLESVRAVSGERALDVVSEREGIPLAELDAVDHGTMERPGLGLLPMFSMELGPEFAEPGPTMQSVPWAQTEARLEAQRETGPAGPGKEV